MNATWAGGHQCRRTAVSGYGPRAARSALSCHPTYHLSMHVLHAISAILLAVQAYDVQAYDVQAYDVQAYDVQAYDVQAYDVQAYEAYVAVQAYV
jgi:hypothetical protein